MNKIAAIFKNIIKICCTLYFKCRNKSTIIQTGKNTLILSTTIKSSQYKHNIINVGKNVSIRNCNFIFYGSCNRIYIHDGAQLNNVTFWIEDEHNEIIIGEKTTFHGNCQLAACEGTTISIGNDCMFSHDVYIRTTDSHSIIKGDKRINLAKNINISNHVWIGMQCLILKGANIPMGCIIGARSIISSSEMQANCIYAGTPAKVVKKDISWKRERI